MSGPETRPAQFRVSREVSSVDTFFFTYDAPDAAEPVIAGVRFGGGSEVTVYTRAQAQEIADAFTGLVAQFAKHEARAAQDGESR